MNNFYLAEQKIISYSHSFKNDHFGSLTQGHTNIYIKDIDKSSFKLCIKGNKNDFTDINHFITAASLITSTFLFSFNVCTVGLFSFLHPPHSTMNIYLQNKVKINFKCKTTNNYNFVINDISSDTYENILLFFLALSQVNINETINEYLKGIFHLTYDNIDLNFYKDAFSNFYRAFENLVTIEILKVKNLNNEKREIKEAIKKTGIKQEVIDLFDEIYLIRSNQIMHAQKKQFEIKMEDTLKIKLFLDFLIGYIYSPLIKKLLSNKKDFSISS